MIPEQYVVPWERHNQMTSIRLEEHRLMTCGRGALGKKQIQVREQTGWRQDWVAFMSQPY